MKAFFAICLVLILALSGCGATPQGGAPEPPAPTEPPTPPGQEEQAGQGRTGIPGLNAENYPLVDGSTANMPLLAKLYSEICGVSVEEAESMVSVSGGTGAAWRSFLWGGSDILIVYEAPDGIPEEFEEAGIQLEIDPIGRDGLVFLVNKANPVNDLAAGQLRDIYTGRITDWQDAGGAPGPITAFQRNPDSGSQTLFLKLLMDGIEPMKPPVELVPASMSGFIEAVAGFDGSGGAIGYSVFYYADLMYANPDLKILSVDGVAPSFDSISGGEYPLINDFYIVIRADAPSGSPERLLRDWLLTDEGAALLKEARYVPV